MVLATPIYGSSTTRTSFLTHLLEITFQKKIRRSCWSKLVSLRKANVPTREKGSSKDVTPTIYCTYGVPM